MDDLEGQIESYDLGQKSLADEISELEGDENVDAMLEDLKARMASADAHQEQSVGGSVESKQDKR